MASTPSSRKAKGRNFQKEIVMDLRDSYHFDAALGEECYEGDISARVMGASGTDVVLSPMARITIPFNIECKAQENLNIWSALKQAEANSVGRIPLLLFKRNRTEAYACLKWKDLLELVK